MLREAINMFGVFQISLFLSLPLSQEKTPKKSAYTMNQLHVHKLLLIDLPSRANI